MTRREIATLACKILALWMLAQAAFLLVGPIIMTIAAVTSGSTDRPLFSEGLAGAAIAVAPALAMLIIGLFFRFRASHLAAHMVSDDPAPVTRPDIAQADVMAIAFSAVGVFLFVPVLRELAGVFIRVARGEYRFAEYWANVTWQANFWSLIIELAMGLWLIFGSRGIVRIVLWARHTPPESGGESADSQSDADDRPGAR